MLFRTGRHEDKEEIERVMGLAQTQDMDKDMDRTVGGVGWGGEGGAGPLHGRVKYLYLGIATCLMSL